MNKRQIFVLMAIILALVLAAYAYFHNRQGTPSHDPSPGTNSAATG